jgi:hypothetical protein
MSAQMEQGRQGEITGVSGMQRLPDGAALVVRNAFGFYSYYYRYTIERGLALHDRNP